MCKMVLIGLLAVVAMIGNVTAQRECSRDLEDGSDICVFQCSAGDYLYVEGSIEESVFLSVDETGARYYGAKLRVTADCGGARVTCEDYTVYAGGPPPIPVDLSCSEWSGQAASREDTGWCDIGFAGRGIHGYCRSVTPEEAAELQASGQGLVIQIPEK